MKVIDQTTLSADVMGRVTVGEHQGHEYAYLFVVNTCLRYEVKKGHLSLIPPGIPVRCSSPARLRGGRWWFSTIGWWASPTDRHPRR